MSFLNSGIDVTSFMGDSFDTGMAVNARNRANAYMKGSAAKRAGRLAGKGLDLFGESKRKDLLRDAGAYAQQQTQNAGMFGTVMDLVGGIGRSAALGGFGGGPTAEIGGKTYGVDLSQGEINDLGIETGAGPGNNFMLPQLFN